MKGAWGLVAEFRSADDLVRGAREVREAGYTKWDAHAPFPVHGLDEAMGLRKTILPWLVLGAGATGCVLAYLMQWWMNGVNYRLIIGGKPFNSIPSDIPVIFEVTVLLASLTAFFAMLGLNKLPEFAHPLFKNASFRRATSHAFFISVEAVDPRFDAERTERLLRDAGSTRVEWIEA
jgi:ActD protein